MVHDHRITRRQLLKSGAAGAAAAAAMATLGPSVALGVGRAKLIPTDKVGTITFTQRDVPEPDRDRRQRHPRPGPDDGQPRAVTTSSRTRTVKDRWSHSPAAGRSCSSSWRASAIKQVEFAGYTQNGANPGGAQPPIAPQGDYNPASQTGPISPMGVPCAGFLDEFGLEAIGNHGFIPGTWPGRCPTAGWTPRRGRAT